jgi:hypothetical protein
MPKPINIRIEGFEKHYRDWAESHPDAIPYEKLIQLLDNGDEFGRKVPLEVLAKLCKTSKNTMFKWVQVHREVHSAQDH